jgi:release factor glutamine methyltransferase
MKLIQEVLSEVAKTFHDCGFSNSKRQAEELLCELLNCSRAQLYSDQKRPLNAQEWQIAQLWVQRRLKGEPLAYLSGKVQFYGCLIEVNPAVLIPRPETEILVDKVVTHLKKQNLDGKVLWDLCCGSGCMGIALKKALPALSVYLSDYSEQALDLAARNAVVNGVKVTCLRGDLLAPFHGKKTHYLVCNPPYISESEYAILDKEVKEYEPRLALVAGQTGLEMYARLAQDLPNYLHAGGQVWLEMGYQQGTAVQQLFQGPPWKKSLVENDWAGHSRFFFLEIE